MLVLNYNPISHMVWQPYWIEGNILNNVYSGTAALINVSLHSYDVAFMWNACFKFQPDRLPHSVAAILD